MKPEIETRLDRLERDAMKLGWILFTVLGFGLILAAYISSQEM